MQVLADPLLSRFFSGVSTERLKAHQVTVSMGGYGFPLLHQVKQWIGGMGDERRWGPDLPGIVPDLFSPIRGSNRPGFHYPPLCLPLRRWQSSALRRWQSSAFPACRSGSYP